MILECSENAATKRLVFSGDIGRWGLPIIRDPQIPEGGADLVIMESTYGDREHPPFTDMRSRLAAIVKDTAARGGRVLIPAFAVGRVQELVYDLHALARDATSPRVERDVNSDAGGDDAPWTDAKGYAVQVLVTGDDYTNTNTAFTRGYAPGFMRFTLRTLSLPG